MPEPITAQPAKQRVRRSFDQAALSYDAAAAVQRTICDRLGVCLDHAGRTLQPAHILDAGCGTGYGALELRRRWPNAALTLLDFAPAMLAVARAHGHRAALLCADLEALPLAGQSCDLYWSSLAWQWNVPQRCLSEAARVLRPGGTLAIATLGADNFPELRHAFAAVDGYDHVLSITPAEQLLAACRAGGWTVRVWERQAVRRHYPDLRSLLGSVKAVGALRARSRESGRMPPSGRTSSSRIRERPRSSSPSNS